MQEILVVLFIVALYSNIRFDRKYLTELNNFYTSKVSQTIELNNIYLYAFETFVLASNSNFKFCMQ